ncbi:MAG: hypothetical protein ACJAWY_003292, partial [Sphingomonas echinoides]
NFQFSFDRGSKQSIKVDYNRSNEVSPVYINTTMLTYRICPP